ncbi:discoidin domain-containing protein [Shewanella sp. TB4-MNA-CIBAN-0142]|uniref:discoidin domain-containing protein n=1 Tax=Shewanella sp. TB4-MNA-CIBAN-0142 TaxID=3140464 RepID=UPI00331EFDB9
MSHAVTQVYVTAGEVGQGFLLNRLDQCYLVTPKHVIGDEFFATLISGTHLRSLGEAEPIQTFGYDLSILSVMGAAEKECQTNINQFGVIEVLLQNATQLTISSINADGSRSLIPVTLTDKGLIHLRVNPVSSDVQLYKGLSGSLAFINDIPVGMLQSIDADTGEGILLRQDRIIETILPFFQSSSAILQKPKLNRTTESPTALINLSVENWSQQALNNDSRIANLIDGNLDTSWRVPPTGFPLSVEFSTGGKTKLIKNLILSNNSDDKLTFIKDFEILASRKSAGKRGWTSIYSGTWINNKNSKKIEIPPIKAKRLMLLVHTHWGSTSEISLSEFMAN